MSLSIATWLVGIVALGGVLLAGVHLAERPVRGAARWAAIAHGLSGAAGVALALAALPRGFGTIAGWTLGLALLLGLGVAVQRARRRRPAGLLVALHAVIGAAGAVLLLAAGSLPQ